LVMKSTESFEIFWLELLVPQVGHDSASIDLLFLPHPHLCKNSSVWLDYSNGKILSVKAEELTEKCL